MNLESELPEEGITNALQKVQSELETQGFKGLRITKADLSAYGMESFYGIFDGPNSVLTVKANLLYHNGKRYVSWDMGVYRGDVREAAQKHLGAYAKEIGCDLSLRFPR